MKTIILSRRGYFRKVRVTIERKGDSIMRMGRNIKNAEYYTIRDHNDTPRGGSIRNKSVKTNSVTIRTSAIM